LINVKSAPPNMGPNPERRTKPVSQQEKELTEALQFLVSNLQMHAEEYHHKARKVKRCEAILEEAISELIARKERDAGAGTSTRWRKKRSK
jgi:hypothetical protein